MTRIPQPSTAARVDLERQHRAHDVLDLLIAQAGAVQVLDILRYLYIVGGATPRMAQRDCAPPRGKNAAEARPPAALK